MMYIELMFHAQNTKNSGALPPGTTLKVHLNISLNVKMIMDILCAMVRNGWMRIFI